MALTDTDLLLVQRGDTPHKTTVDKLAEYTNSKITLGNNEDIPIASNSQLGVIKVGSNLDIGADGTLNAVIPPGLAYKGAWSNAASPPSPVTDGDFYIWDGADATLNNTDWGSANSETVTEADRLFYSNGDWAVITTGSGGLTEITGTAPISVSGVVDGEQDVSMAKATASVDGFMPKEAFAKLDGIDPGANVNVNPTQAYTSSANNGTLTLTPGGDTTVIPAATATTAGLMTADDKTKLENVVSNPGGIVSLVAGDGISINTTAAPGTSGTPEVNVKFYVGPGETADDTTLVMPANIDLLGDLP